MNVKNYDFAGGVGYWFGKCSLIFKLNVYKNYDSEPA